MEMPENRLSIAVLIAIDFMDEARSARAMDSRHTARSTSKRQISTCETQHYTLWLYVSARSEKGNVEAIWSCRLPARGRRRCWPSQPISYLEVLREEF